MLRGILGQHATAHRWDLKRAHRVTITVCVTDQAQHDLRSACGPPYRGGPGVPPPIWFQVGVAIPIPAVKDHPQSCRSESSHIGQAIRIGAASEHYIWKISKVETTIFGKVDLRRICER